MIAVFGDHGEAFWDLGGPFGHSSRLSEAQTHVPFLFCAPNPIQTNYRITSHADIFPTIFDWMGVVAPTAFMTGKSLMRYDPALDYAVLRNIVNRGGASNIYALIEPGQRTGFLLLNPPRITWMQDDEENPLTLVPYRTAHAYATMLGASALRSPSSRKPY
jgi:membrane-anchored protein YejM (alkaline phosphatase superfamily)